MAGKFIFSVFGLFFALFGTLFVNQEWKNLQETKAMQEWAETPCTIVSSNIEDYGEDYRLSIAFSYTVDEKIYTGERYGKQPHQTAETFVEVEQLHKQLPEGKTVSGFYNPQNPSEAILNRPTIKEARKAVGFTLIFPAFGLLFAALPWLRGRKSTTTGGTKSQRTPRTALILFGLIFTVVGLALLKPILINPLNKTRDAQNWISIPATVVSSKVKSHSDDDGTTYSVYIAYRYELNGTEYVGDQYSFMSGSSSGQSSKAEIVRQYPKGHQFNLFVNPADPAESVIKRDYSLSLLFGLIPVIFAIVGIAVMMAGFRNKKPTLDMSQAREHVILLKGSSRIRKMAGLMIFTIFWNGVVYLLTVSDAPRMFPVIFGLFGVILIGLSIQAILSMFNPQPTVELTPGDIRPGASIAMRWRTSGRTDRIDTLSIELQCLKITTETSGTGKNRSTRIVKKPLFTTEVLKTTNQAEIAQGTSQFEIPLKKPASRPGNHNGIRWQVVFHGEITRWPDMKDELSFTVYPTDAEERLTD